MFHAKIAVVGPCEAGKTVLSNFLGDQTDKSHGSYDPTVGVRILEFESLVDNAKIDVELWDCSGKEDYEACWPAMAYQADGVIIVFDPYDRNSTPIVKTFYNNFVVDKNLQENHCILFANCKEKDTTNIKSPIPSLPVVIANVEKNSDDVRDSFNGLLRNVFDKLSDSRERQELSIIA